MRTLKLLLFILLLAVGVLARAGQDLSSKNLQGVRVNIKEVFTVPHTDLSKVFLRVSAPVGSSVWVDPDVDVYPIHGSYRSAKMKNVRMVTPDHRTLMAGQQFQTADVVATVPNEPVTLHLWLIDRTGHKRELLVNLDMPELASLEANRLINEYVGFNFEALAGTSLDSISGQEETTSFNADNKTFTGGLPQYQLRFRYGWRPRFYLLSEFFGRMSGKQINASAPDQRTQSDVMVGVGENLAPSDTVIFRNPFRVVRQAYIAIDDEAMPLLNYTSATTSETVNLHNLYVRTGGILTLDSEKGWFLKSHFQFGYMVASSGFTPYFAFIMGGRFMYGHMFNKQWYAGAELDGFYRELNGRYQGSHVSYSYLSGNALLVLGYHPLGVKTRLW